MIRKYRRILLIRAERILLFASEHTRRYANAYMHALNEHTHISNKNNANNIENICIFKKQVEVNRETDYVNMCAFSSKRLLRVFTTNVNRETESVRQNN